MSVKRSSSLSKPRRTSSNTAKQQDTTTTHNKRTTIKDRAMYESIFLQVFDTLDEEVSTSDELLLLLQVMIIPLLLLSWRTILMMNCLSACQMLMIWGSTGSCGVAFICSRQGMLTKLSKSTRDPLVV